MDKDLEVKFLSSILAIITLFGIMETQLKFLPASIFGILCIEIKRRFGEIKPVSLEEGRKHWFRSLLEPFLPGIEQNMVIHHQVLAPDSNTLRFLELGIMRNHIQQGHTLPDLTQAEIEVTRLEERASLILGTLVFIPTVFALIHLFREVTLSLFLLELFCSLVIGWTVISTQRMSYKLDDWDSALSYLKQSRNQLVTNPRKHLSLTDPFSSNFHMQDLGMAWDLISDSPAIEFYFQMMNLVVELRPRQRSLLIERLIEELRILPQTQIVLTNKWNAYRNRVMLISLTSTALSALFVSLSTFSLPELATSGLDITSTPYLLWGQLLLIMVLNGLVWQNWYKLPSIVLYSSLFGALYFFFYGINGLIS